MLIAGATKEDRRDCPVLSGTQRALSGENGNTTVYAEFNDAWLTSTGEMGSFTCSMGMFDASTCTSLNEWQATMG